jgi:Transglycosylase SLT domain
MDLLNTILACSLYLADDDLVRAIAQSNSHSNPYFVEDATLVIAEVDPPLPPKTAPEAIARYHDVVAEDGRPLLGLMQIVPAWLDAFGRDLPDAFEPCTNIAVGTAMLSQFAYECAKAGAPGSGPKAASKPWATSPQTRACVLRKYEDAIAMPDFATITTLELRYQRRVTPPVADAPIFPAGSARAWGPDQIIVHAPIAYLLHAPASSP